MLSLFKWVVAVHQAAEKDVRGHLAKTVDDKQHFRQPLSRYIVRTQLQERKHQGIAGESR